MNIISNTLIIIMLHLKMPNAFAETPGKMLGDTLPSYHPKSDLNVSKITDAEAEAAAVVSAGAVVKEVVPAYRNGTGLYDRDDVLIYISLPCNAAGAAGVVVSAGAVAKNLSQSHPETTPKGAILTFS